MTKIDFISDGTVTSPEGFLAGAVAAGIKKRGTTRLDLGILFSESPCDAAAVFTTNQIKAAPVVLSQQRVASGRATAIVMNSGCANAVTGEQGFADAVKTTELVAQGLGVAPEEVLVASTGVIGVRLPMARIEPKLAQIVLSRDGGHDLEQAIMTTDTVPKEVAVKVVVDGVEFTIGGVAKGSGMIHPNMATMLSVISTDARVDPHFLGQALHKAVEGSFNVVDVDGDTSTNDMCLLMANGLAQNAAIKSGGKLAKAFQDGLNQVCTYLAKAVARDGEGATKLIEVTVTGAKNVTDARKVALTVVSSPLVKTAVYGNDPNPGRVLAAVGRSGVEVVEEKINLYFGDICLFRAGTPVKFVRKTVEKILKAQEVSIKVELNLGKATGAAWGCDLTEKYIEINAEYTT